MPSWGAAKAGTSGSELKVAEKGGAGEGPKEGDEIGEKFHAIHAKMAKHLAGISTHLAGLHEAHAALGKHFGVKMPGKSAADAMEPTEGDENV